MASVSNPSDDAFAMKRRCDSVAYNAVCEVMAFKGRQFPLTDTDSGVAYLISKLLMEEIAVDQTTLGYKPTLKQDGSVASKDWQKELSEKVADALKSPAVDHPDGAKQDTQASGGVPPLSAMSTADIQRSTSAATGHP